jgi:predicted nucleotidyltransferase
MSNPERWKRFADLPADLGARLERLPAFLAARDVQIAYLFGSLAETVERTPGDIDLAILTRDEPVHLLREDLYEVLGTQRLDLVDLDRASPLLRFHIVRDGDLLYARDTDALNRFELATLHLYRDTAPLRRRHREILKERMNAWS